MNMSEKQETEEDHSLKKNIIDYIDYDNNKKMPLEVICI
jgi:hypothetical protein